jgi:small multidrug resistance family-3 protein
LVVETATIIPPTLALFLLAAVCEIGGGYLIWLWLRKHKGLLFGLLGGITLFVYGVIPTLQPSNFGRVYSAYGGIFILLSIVWGRLVDKKRPDRYEVIGSVIATIGAAVIFYSPRH